MEAVNIDQQTFVYNPVSMVEVVLLADKMEKGLLQTYPRSVYDSIVGFKYDSFVVPEEDSEVQEDRDVFELCQQAFAYQDGENLSPDAEWTIMSKYLKGLAIISGHKPELFMCDKEDYFLTKESMRLLMKDEILFKPIRIGNSIVNVGLYYGSPRYQMIMRRLANVLINGAVVLARPADKVTYATLAGRKRDSLTKEQLEKTFRIQHLVLI